MKKILVTRKPPKYLLEHLKEEFEVEVWNSEEQKIPQEVLFQYIDQVDGILCLLTDQITKELIDKGKKLKVISNLAVGYNNIDLDAATSNGIIVTNTPGVLTETTADLTFALLLATARRLIEASNELRMGNWKTWAPMMLAGRDVHGSTLGIIGLGDIGAAVARRAKGFGMKVIYHNRTPKPELEKEIDINYSSQEFLLRNSDFVCILTPLTAETQNLISLDELKMMKETAVLINTSRGGIVNENDLVTALSTGMIWGAGLDVYEEEPLPTDHPLLSLRNVTTLPHIGSASVQTRLKMWDLAALNLTYALQGKEPPSAVNEIGDK
ncbi:D-glycerate dehydrogenase [Shouchella clausii]|uniref:D-glycerate dehydrogenase n=1 Tax=Shouchella clausii TaxID=79880 RepID=A0A268S0N1_SHOCL|nr:D-glycerate dehydrogenase [Shouchella clausii]PAD42440.1 D-glycerate dehydrogenase [Bacillus sp. 7520-S]MBU8597391.1 D-glycerate dehydrogenase [Shouchella clausii]MCY1105054.1 D-glycerate dehydrogenase [Shouchella clausii]PAD08446.1 D-glycerate dehydrogenase [Shouchella clausii]PAE81104.1 D-glycerate dehydrogenase [Shouchella clausii]